MYDIELPDPTKLRYALYARKSTDDPQRQVRSIDDQIAECLSLANQLGIHPHPILKETKSAKTPGKRPLFNQLLKDLRTGKYDGILAWNPDRLARNMKEGGEVIDMIDEGIIKDLKFVTHHFTPDANGKMLLGMSFVLSKQYSDDLSQKVTRGVRRSLAEGKSSGTPKHGYIRSEDGLYQPDGKNFELIRQAWDMRLNGVGLQEIVSYLDDHGYRRTFKASSKGKDHTVKLSVKTLSLMFHDPFYYGLLIQAKQPIDLREIYDFKPAVAEDEYNFIQRLSKQKATPMQNKRRTAFFPLRGLVTCSFCGSKMYPGASKSRIGTRYLYYRCANKACTRTKKSIRAKEVFSFIYSSLEHDLEFSESDYRRYKASLQHQTDARRISLQTRLRSKQGMLQSIKGEAQEIGLGLIKHDQSSRIYEINANQLEKLDAETKKLSEEIETIRQLLANPEQDALSLEQFLNLTKKLSSKVKAADEIGKDAICRILFLNLVVDEEKVVSHLWREPYASLAKTKEFTHGRGDWI